jgi:uridine phosphorylase
LLFINPFLPTYLSLSLSLSLHLSLPISPLQLPVGTEIAAIGKTERFSLFKVGPVISVNHGMGQPSISILLHELAKLLMYAGARDFTFVRIGTSGGIGVPPGTVVISTEALDGQLRAQHDLPILGTVVSRPTHFDLALCQQVLALAGSTATILGKTMVADDFYEGQGRLDGACCEYSDADKMAFLQRAHAAGVRNIEMEGCVFAAFCNKVKIPALDICCTLVDRLNGDQIESTPEQLAGFTENAIAVALNFVAHVCSTKQQTTQ